MGTCTSSNTTDQQCNHNKPYIAICYGEGCSREDGDRRLCGDCLVDHVCPDKAAITDIIQRDRYNLKILVNTFYSTLKDNRKQSQVKETFENLKLNLFDSISSYQLFYQININEFLLEGIPKDLADAFGEAAKQISDVLRNQDFGFLGMEACKILKLTYTNQQIIATIYQNCDQASSKLNNYTSQVESKLKCLCDQFCTNMKQIPYEINRKLQTAQPSLFKMDITKHNYGFSSYITSEDYGRSIKMMSNVCGDHGEKFQVVCCDPNCPNLDSRLCTSCLLTHKCNGNMRIKLKSFSQDQSKVIQLTQLYQKKKGEIDSAKAKIVTAFQEMLQTLKKLFEESYYSTQELVGKSSYANFDEIIQQSLPGNVAKLKQVFENGSMVSLDRQGVKIIAYLLQHPELRDQILGADASETITQFLQQFCVQAEETCKSFLSQLSNPEDCLKNKTIQKQEPSLFQSFLKQENKSIQQQQVQTINNKTNYSIPNTNAVYQQVKFSCDNQLETKLQQTILVKTLNQENDEQDLDYVTDIQIYDNFVFVSYLKGTLYMYQYGTFELIQKIDLYAMKFQCICTLTYIGKPAILCGVGEVDNHNIVLVIYDKTDGLQKMFTMTDQHSNVIFKIRKLQENLFISCSGDHTIKIWDIDNRLLKTTLTYHTNSVRDIILLNEYQLVSCSFDETIKIYDFRSNSVIYELKFTEYLYSMVKISDNVFGVSLGDGSLELYHSQNFEKIKTIKVSDQYFGSMTLIGTGYLLVAGKERQNFIIGFYDGDVVKAFMKNDDYEGQPEGMLFYKDYILFGDVKSIKIYQFNN